MDRQTFVSVAVSQHWSEIYSAMRSSSVITFRAATCRCDVRSWQLRTHRLARSDSRGVRIWEHSAV